MTRFSACILVVLASLLVGGDLFADDLRPPRRDGAALRKTPVVKVFETCKNSVVDFVSIRAQGKKGKLYEFFRLPAAERKKIRQVGVGAGFVIHPSGYILTNAHVVRGAIHRRAVLATGKSYEAEIVAVDSKNDLALIKIDAPAPLKPATLGLAGDIMVGEQLVLIGNPHGLAHTCTVGIVSALGRNIRAGGVLHRGVVQADLGINPGNSGGPIFNILGEVCGMAVSMKQNSQNIAFAIPVDRLRRALPAMLDAERRYGLTTGLTIHVNNRATLATVAKNSPAQTAGLQAGDVLQRVGGRVIDSHADLSLALVGVQPGQAISIEYTRNRRQRSTKLIPGARKRLSGEAVLAKLLGMKAHPIASEKAKAMGLRSDRALVVTEIDAQRYKGASAPREGDLLAAIGGRAPRSLDHVADLFATLRKGQTMPIVLLRVADGKATRIDINLVVK